jgi:hypothetical protein
MVSDDYLRDNLSVVCLQKVVGDRVLGVLLHENGEIVK